MGALLIFLKTHSNHLSISFLDLAQMQLYFFLRKRTHKVYFLIHLPGQYLLIFYQVIHLIHGNPDDSQEKITYNCDRHRINLLHSTDKELETKDEK